MERASPAAATDVLAARLCAFVLERFPFAVDIVREALGTIGAADDPRDTLPHALRSRLARVDVAGLPDTTPRVTATERLRQAADALIDACDGFLARETIADALTADERREILRGMILTRAVDNRLKLFFGSGEVVWRGTPFQGKGFRSLGQEAIYAAALRLRRGASWRGADGTWRGDVVAPIIRDLGVALAMRPDPATVRT